MEGLDEGGDKNFYVSNRGFLARKESLIDNGQDIVHKISSQDIVHRRSLTIE